MVTRYHQRRNDYKNNDPVGNGNGMGENFGYGFIVVVSRYVEVETSYYEPTYVMRAVSSSNSNKIYMTPFYTSTTTTSTSTSAGYGTFVQRTFREATGYGDGHHCGSQGREAQGLYRDAYLPGSGAPPPDWSKRDFDLFHGDLPLVFIMCELLRRYG